MRKGISRIRNEALAKAFFYMNLIEGWGSGIQKINATLKDAGLKEMEITGGDVFLKFVILRNQNRVIAESGQENGDSGRANGDSGRANGDSGRVNGDSGQENGENGQGNNGNGRVNGENGQGNNGSGQENGENGRANGDSGRVNADSVAG